MTKSYCVRERRPTDNVPGSERYTKTKNNRLVLKTTCASCGGSKSRFVKNQQQGTGIATDIGGVAADALIHHGIPWLGKKLSRWDGIIYLKLLEIQHYKKRLLIMHYQKQLLLFKQLDLKC